MEKRNNAIKERMMQVILIVFSVVLGVYLSERIEERKNNQEADRLFGLIKSEVKDNTKLVEDLYLYHQEIHDNLDSLQKEEEFVAAFIEDKNTLSYRLFMKGSFIHRYPANDAWDIAKSHPLIANIDYDKLLVLSKIYKQQQGTFEPVDEMFELYHSKDVNIEKDAKPNLGIILKHIHELAAREKTLMHYYQEAEAFFEKNYKRKEKKGSR